ncbi:MAG TPA: hypothetical protein DDY86_06410 [Syntrophaceae bacterium]|nr:hypothetical protein [Syntrophaceae bacterium]
MVLRLSKLRLIYCSNRNVKHRLYYFLKGMIFEGKVISLSGNMAVPMKLIFIYRNLRRKIGNTDHHKNRGDR